MQLAPVQEAATLKDDTRQTLQIQTVSITNSALIHIVQNQEDSAPNKIHILVNNHKKYSGPRHKDSIIRHHFECTTQRREDYRHTPGTRTPRHPRN